MEIDTKVVSAAHAAMNEGSCAIKPSELEKYIPGECLPLDLCKIIAAYLQDWKLKSSLHINDTSVQKEGWGRMTYALTHIRYKNNPTIISGASNIQIWDLDGKIHAILEGHAGCVDALACARNKNMLISGSRDKSIKCWQLDDKDIKKSHCTKTLIGHMDWICSLAVSPNETTFASGSYDKTAKLWSIPEGTLLHTFQHDTSDEQEKAIGVSWNYDGTLLLSAATDGSVRVWNVQSKNLLKEFTYQDQILGISASPVTNHVAISTGAVVSLRDIITGEVIQSMESPNCEGVNSTVVFSPLGTRLASMHYKSGRITEFLLRQCVIRIWDVPTGVLLAQLPNHQFPGKLCFVLEDVLVASSHEKNAVNIYSTLD